MECACIVVMPKLIVSEWLALDGVFDSDTMDRWFMPFDSKERGAYIRENVVGSDAVLVGRVTYEMLAAYWPQQKNDKEGLAAPLNAMRKYVVSSSLKRADWNNTTILAGKVEDEVAKLKQQEGRDIIVFGSATLVAALMKADLVDEYRFLIQPIIAGTGKRFFRDGMTVKLKPSNTKSLPNGVMLVCYQPAHDM